MPHYRNERHRNGSYIRARIAPIISGVGLGNFMPSRPAYRTLRQVQRCVTISWVHGVVICFQLSVAAMALNNMRYKHSLHL